MKLLLLSGGLDWAERDRLLEAANEAYWELRSNADAWREELAERALWDGTLEDGLEPPV